MKLFKITIAIIAVTLTISSCIKDLDSKPIDPNTVTSATVFNTPSAYKEALAKIYAGLAITGQKGPAGQSDITVTDEGFTSYLRLYWCAQELSTDEAINTWTDEGLPDFHFQNWTSSNSFIRYLYDRIFYQVSLCNQYLRSVTPLVDGLSEPLKSEVTQYLAEARFMRALSYYHGLDLFGNIPLVTEKDPIGSFLPKQVTRDSLFRYIESELIAIEPNMVDARQNEYARADKACVWALLAKLYLNSKVYLGAENTAYYTKCITNCANIIASGYSIHSSYPQLFMADNNNCTDEIIFAVAFDGTHTQTWGGMTFVISAEIGGTMISSDFGSNQKWGGNRTTKSLVNLFTNASDQRAMFHTDGQKLEITSTTAFTDGYAIKKFSNKKSNGSNGSNLTYVDTDYPVFRYSEIYLMYAEAILRGGTGGNIANAVTYINEMRNRAYGGTSGNIDQAALTLNFILDEKARELYWECSRRTDLIRYGRFSQTSVVWPWKGGVINGKSTDATFDLYPIPSSDIGANPTLIQNDGY